MDTISKSVVDENFEKIKNFMKDKKPKEIRIKGLVKDSLRQISRIIHFQTSDNFDEDEQLALVKHLKDKYNKGYDTLTKYLQNYVDINKTYDELNSLDGTDFTNKLKSLAEKMEYKWKGKYFTAAEQHGFYEFIRKEYEKEDEKVVSTISSKLLERSSIQQKATLASSEKAKKLAGKIDNEVDYDKNDKEKVKEVVSELVKEKPTENDIDEAVKTIIQQTGKEETKDEQDKIKKILTEDINTPTTEEKPKLTQQTQAGETHTTEKPKLTQQTQAGETHTTQKPKLTQQTQAGETHTTQKPKLTQQTQAEQSYTSEPIIERAYVSEQQQMKLDSEIPSNFSSTVFNQKPKEGKTKMSDLNEEFSNPIQYPEQLLKWVNLIGGWEQYKYNRSKFGLVDDVKGDAQYLENMKRCTITVCGDDIGVQDLPVGNINQAVKELMIMKNCYYIYKFKSSLPPQYGLIVNANKLMTFADILGKGATSSMKPGEVAQKPVVKGKERIEFEEEKKALISQLVEPKEGPIREFVPKPDITKETIHKSQIQRGNRGLMQINMESLNKRTVNQGSMMQADAIARGIKIMKPKKQFGRY